MAHIRTLAAMWATLEDTMFRFDEIGALAIGRDERNGARVMFYAGARALFMLIDACGSADEFVEVLQGARAELDTFTEDNKRKAAPMMQQLEVRDGKVYRRARPEGHG